MASKKAKKSKAKDSEKKPKNEAATKATDASEVTSQPAEPTVEDLEGLTSELATAMESLTAKDEELQQVREALARARADFSNFRRRTQQEQEEQGKFATALLVAEFLPILDNFERALDTIPSELRFFSWLQGVDLVHQMARSVLEKRGLQAIDTHEKAFDPNYHEVVMREGEDEGSEVVVLEELQKGYVMHDRVLRPSLVKVGPPPDKAEPSAEQDEASTAEKETPSKTAAQTDIPSETP